MTGTVVARFSFDEGREPSAEEVEAALSPVGAGVIRVGDGTLEVSVEADDGADVLWNVLCIMGEKYPDAVLSG